MWIVYCKLDVSESTEQANNAYKNILAYGTARGADILLGPGSDNKTGGLGLFWDKLNYNTYRKRFDELVELKTTLKIEMDIVALENLEG